MNCYNTIDKSDGELFKNWGSNSLYSDFEPHFKYTYDNVYIIENRKRSFYRISLTPTLNNRISPTTSLNTFFWRRAWY